jgi:hypothetical protein
MSGIMKKCGILAALLLAGCAINKVDEAKDAYIACVKIDPNKCESERLAYDAELAAFNMRVRAAAALN